MYVSMYLYMYTDVYIYIRVQSKQPTVIILFNFYFLTSQSCVIRCSLQNIGNKLALCPPVCPPPTPSLLQVLFQRLQLGQGFPDSSVGKESTCNAGDPDLIPGSGRCTGEGKDYPLQFSWASLVAQLVKNSPAMRQTWVQFLGWEDPLEKGKATHSSILIWRIPWM